MNGILDSSWKSVSVVNTTTDTIPYSGRILLYAKYNQSALFFFAELQFATKFQNETLSLYLSNSNTTVGAVYTDARQITIYNATQYGNDSYSEQALYKNSSSYITDPVQSYFDGVGKVNSNGYRDYEYELNFTSTNDTGNVSLQVSNMYALEFGLNSSSTTGIGNVTNPLLVQIGPIPVAPPSALGTFNIDVSQIFLYILFLVLAFYVGYGIILLRSRRNIDYTAISEANKNKSESSEKNEIKDYNNTTSKERKK